MAHAGASGVILALLAGCGADLSPVTRVQDPVSIPIEDSLPQERRLSAPAGWPVAVTVAGQGVDVKATVVVGSETRHCDAPNRRMGVETLVVEAGHGGAIAIRIERNDHSGARGLATLEAIALPIATADDRTRLEALRQEARACLAFPEVARAAESASAYEAAARTWHGLGDLRRAGLAALHAAGVRYLRNADWRSASALAAEAYSDLERVDAAPHAAYALRLEGAALDLLANSADYDSRLQMRTTRRARERLTEAAKRFGALGMPYETGFAFSYRGVSFESSGDWDRSRADFNAALEQFELAKDGPAQAIALQSLAYQSFEDGRSLDARREFDRALALIPREEDPGNYAHTLHNSALPFRVLGQFDEAISRHYEAAEILRALGDWDGEARALHSLGLVMWSLGDGERASELLRAAIALRGSSGARREQATALVNLAEIERAAGRVSAAVALNQEALSHLTAPVDRARALLSLARDQRLSGDTSLARNALDEIFRLGLPETNRFVAQALTELADLESVAGNLPGADEYFARALKAHGGGGAETDRARTLQRRAESRLRSGDLPGALADASGALAIFDGIGVQTLYPEARAAFRASYRDAVETRIDALLRKAEASTIKDPARRQGLLREALATSERARAQLLSESLGVDDTSVPDALRSERQRTYELLAGKRQQHDRLRDLGQGDSKHALDLLGDIEYLRTQAQVLEGRIDLARRGDRAPAAASAHSDSPLPPSGVVVAEYFLGRNSNWLFEIRDGSVTVHQLGAGSDLEALARELHESWRAAGSGDREALGRRLARQMFGPIRDVADARSLWIVPDGALHLVPVALLARLHWQNLAPGAALTIPALATIRPRAPDGKAAEHTLALVADPIYEEDDPRIRATERQEKAHVEPTRAIAGDGQRFRRLPATAIEARELAALVPDVTQKLVLAGADATRQRVIGAQLGRYRLVHFAAHAVADSRDPALAMLALSSYDSEGRPLDGALRHYDIQQLRLNADLVVLSGCDTALGREFSGEGPIGLSQAFLQSGARSVVATLWKVPDTSTAMLMRAFYRELLENDRAPAAALEIAQAALRRQPRWSDPYYWAGFQLVSNDQLDAGNNKNVAGREES